MEWTALIWPILGVMVLFAYFKKNVVWWELFVPVAVSLAAIGIAKVLFFQSSTSDTEYIGDLAQTATYYEDWNKKIPCAHPRFVSGPNGQMTYIGNMHAYDVRYHSEYWEIVSKTGFRIRISQSHYSRLTRQFGNSKFVDMHRSYHTNDGDKYVSTWDGSEPRAEAVTVFNTYENRVQTNRSLFGFEEVSEEDIKSFRLYNYPWSASNVRATLGQGGLNRVAGDRKLDYLNGYLGPRKQLRIWLLIFTDQSRRAGELQESHWDGGNKNEFVITVGIDKDNAVKWCHPFSWTPEEITKIEIRDFVMSQPKLDILQVADFAGDVLGRKFIRQEFEEFSYIDIPLSMTAITVIHLLTILACVLAGLWIVKNNIDHEGGERTRK